MQVKSTAAVSVDSLPHVSAKIVWSSVGNIKDMLLGLVALWHCVFLRDADVTCSWQLFFHIFFLRGFFQRCRGPSLPGGKGLCSSVFTEPDRSILFLKVPLKGDSLCAKSGNKPKSSAEDHLATQTHQP